MTNEEKKEQLEREIKTICILAAHFEACDTLLLNSNSIFTFNAKRLVKRVQREIRAAIKSIESRLDEEQIEQLDLWADYYEQILNEGDKMIQEQLNNGESDKTVPQG